MLSSNYNTGASASNIGGRVMAMNSNDKRHLIKDPMDIDDDVSDHGPESLENQIKELDGTNKYL